MTDLNRMYEIRDEDDYRRDKGLPPLIRDPASILMSDGHQKIRSGVRLIKFALLRGMSADVVDDVVAALGELKRLEDRLYELNSPACHRSPKRSVDLLTDADRWYGELEEKE